MRDQDYNLKTAIETSYSMQEIVEFRALTGINGKETYKLLKNYCSIGIHSLWQINHLVKLGHYSNHRI